MSAERRAVRGRKAREQYERRRALYQCVECGRKVKRGSRCVQCAREASRERKRNWYLARRMAGLCTRCSRPSEGKLVWCRACAGKDEGRSHHAG